MRRRAMPILVATGLFAVGAAAGWGARAAWSQGGPPRMTTNVLLRHVTDEIPRPVDLRVHLNRWDPGADRPP